MLLCICSVIDRRRHQHKWHLPSGLVCHFFVLTIFEIVCDLDYFISEQMHIRETKKCYWCHVLNIVYHSMLTGDWKSDKSAQMVRKFLVLHSQYRKRGVPLEVDSVSSCECFSLFAILSTLRGSSMQFLSRFSRKLLFHLTFNQIPPFSWVTWWDTQVIQWGRSTSPPSHSPILKKMPK